MDQVCGITWGGKLAPSARLCLPPGEGGHRSHSLVAGAKGHDEASTRRHLRQCLGILSRAAQ
eukprot:4695286-Pyramimonas_sp.AAC.1